MKTDTPYDVYVDKFFVHVVDFKGEQVEAFHPVNKPITNSYLKYMLNEAYAKGIQDAAQAVVDGIALGPC